MHNKKNMYEATPIEQAYSLYIGHQIFNNDCNNAVMSIHIPGRVAVPFLTQSGIDRSILKTIWSVADPQNVGTLTTIHQFRILLRLVSMAQAGILQIHHSNSEMNGFLIQQQQQQQQFPLPVFSNVMMPQRNQLMSMYGHLVVVNNSNNNNHQSSAMMTGNNNIASDVTSTATTDNFTSASATTTSQQSIGDAFGALVEVQDVPLGGFPLQSEIDNNNNNNNNNNIPPTIQDPGFSTDFQEPGNIQRNSQMMASTTSSLSDDISFSGGGGGGDYQQQQQQQQRRRQSLQQEQQLPVIPDTTSIPTATAGAGAVSNAFSDFGPTSNSPLPAFNNQTQSIILTEEQDQNDDADDDDFGGFSTAPPVAINSFGGGNDNGTTMNISDAFGDVVSGIQDAPLPPLDATLLTTAEDQNNNNDDDDDDDDDFGGFSAAPSVPMDSIGGESGNGTTMNISDAFGDVASGIQDVPLPPLTTVEDQNDDDDDDDFGGFSAAPSVPMDSIGGESGNGTTLNISDAFGDTVLGIQDAPLPPLTTVEDQNDDDDDNDDDFGGFSAAPSAAMDSIGGESGNGTMNVSDAFGGTVLGIQDVPLPPLTTVEDQNDDDDDDDDDDFGGFSAAPSNRTTMIIPDAFGDASTAKEQDENAIDNIVDEDDDEDDFGGFSATSSVAVDSIGGINSIGGGGGGDGTVGSGDSGPVSNAANTYQHQQQQPFMTDFGRALSEPVSSGIPSISTVTDAGRSLSLDPFGDFAPVENAPLPSLDAFATGIDNIDQSEQTKQATTTALSAEESNHPLDSGSEIFGFGTEPPQMDVQQNASFDKEEIEDGDGDDNDFYAPSSSLGTTNETPTKDQTSLGLDVTETGRPLSITDAFDDMLVQQDTSLPSLEVTIELNINDQNKDNEKEYEAVTEEVSVSINAPQMDVTETGRSLSITDAFDEMLIQQDTALPSLEMMNEPNTEDQSKDNQTDDDEDKVEEWGVFEEAVEEAVESTNSVHEEEDEAVTVIPTSTLDDDDDDDDDWGDFDQAPVIEPQAPGKDFDAMPTSQSQISVDTNDDAEKHQNPLPEAGSDNDEDDWGAFDEAPTAPQVTTEDTEQGNNLFGIDQAAPNLLAEQNCSPLPEEGSDSNEDDWGAFDEAPTAPQVTAEDTEQGDNLFGIDQAAPNLLAEQNRNEEGSDNNDDDWGAFDEAPSAPQVSAYDSDTILKSQSQIPESNDDFEVFLDAPAPNLQSEQPFGEKEIQDDTGSAALTLESEQPTGVEKEEDKNDEDFGDWGRFDAAPTFESEQHKESKEDDDNDDENNFGNFASNEFKNVSAVSTENDFSEEIINRDRIRSLALQLPECLLRKSGVSGEHIDLGEAFEVNIGMKSSMDKCCKRRVARCIEVLESLTSTENSKLASTFWIQIFNVVNEELEQAKSLLDEAKSLSPGEWNEVRAPFSVMLRGLSEYMRVTRSIVASIGDVLLLDESAMLTVDTWASTWCSLSVLEKAISCEKAWKDINKQVTKTPLTVVTAVSIEEIRSHANDPKNEEDLGATNRTFCRLTLQPLKENDKETTKAEVSFQGRQFMACSANFLVNRCPFFVVGDEV